MFGWRPPLRRFTFFLGTHHPHWLGFAAVPLFLSNVTMRRRFSLPRATCDWALDSGGFSEISMHGRWTVPARDYVRRVQRYTAEVGRLRWATTQDWMCEPKIRQLTGLTVVEHQRRTTDSYLELRALAPTLPWAPVIQGFEPYEYAEHAQAYALAGVDLASCPAVGVGSVCRRQSTSAVGSIIRSILSVAPPGTKLHMFGIKTLGIRRAIEAGAVSSDSMAWSFNASKQPPLPGHTHKTCANCIEYALAWRAKVLRPENLAGALPGRKTSWG